VEKYKLKAHPREGGARTAELLLFRLPLFWQRLKRFALPGNGKAALGTHYFNVLPELKDSRVSPDQLVALFVGPAFPAVGWEFSEGNLQMDQLSTSANNAHWIPSKSYGQSLWEKTSVVGPPIDRGPVFTWATQSIC